VDLAHALKVALQTGTVKVTYFGFTTGGGAAPAPNTSAPVPAGSELVFNLSGGGGVLPPPAAGATPFPATPGFQGYMFAQAQFQLCHGFAFITDLGAQHLGSGYLAIEIDTPNWAAGIAGAGTTRTTIIGESQGH
jgi:hypothetical protein